MKKKINIKIKLSKGIIKKQKINQKEIKKKLHAIIMKNYSKEKKTNKKK